MAEDKRKEEIAVIEINEEFMKKKLYEFRTDVIGFIF